MVALLWLVGIIIGIPIAIMVALKFLGLIWAMMSDAAGLIFAIIVFVIICIVATTIL